jgi:hypothetical protein
LLSTWRYDVILDNILVLLTVKAKFRDLMVDSGQGNFYEKEGP